MALELGASGATVYCTGRSVRGQPSDLGRPETIDETAEMVTAEGGRGIAVRVDHTEPEQVEKLFRRVADEQAGQLDILVIDIWGGDPLTQWGKPFWELDLEQGFRLLERAVHAHIVTARHGVPLMVARGSGLVVEVGDGDGFAYRHNLFYDLAKISTIRLGYAMGRELRRSGVTAVALTPGFLRSEAVFEHLGVSAANWRDGVAQDPHFIASETTRFIGRAVVSLAADPNVIAKAAQSLATWHLAREYGFVDVDGAQPHWHDYITEAMAREKAGKAAEAERAQEPK
jgi:NAD(P)-dependent dehydrogenase (short-subunit alcohol dehydrogenase family)